jgi:L-alanine-DL-glutamate epimerase-like enolase superfamily enzyme
MEGAASPTRFIVDRVEIVPIDIDVTDEFVISRGRIDRVENAFVRLVLESGVAGYGEIAPFTDLTGEARDRSVAAATLLARRLSGVPVTEYRRLARELALAAPAEPSARCGLETAMLDAYSRALGIPLWALFGGARVEARLTDITLPILDLRRTLELARHWYGLGFRIFKTKVGADFDRDLERIRALSEAHADAAFVVDANGGFEEDQAINFARELRRAEIEVRLFEQPVARDDLEGLAAVRHAGGYPVAADESVASAADALAVVRAGAADVINLKIMKSGVMEAVAIAQVARAAGLGLMIGGMMETRLAMGCSLALALGLEGIDHLDLDTPLLLATDPLEGGFRYDGPGMSVWHEPGLGMRPVAFR